MCFCDLKVWFCVKHSQFVAIGQHGFDNLVDKNDSNTSHFVKTVNNRPYKGAFVVIIPGPARWRCDVKRGGKCAGRVKQVYTGKNQTAFGYRRRVSASGGGEAT